MFFAHSDFVAGVVNRNFWTCGSFSEVGGSLERKLPFGVLMLSGSALAANRLGRAVRCESSSVAILCGP